MYRYNKNIPDGTRDIIFDEAELYNAITEKLTKVYRADGFERVITPQLEYYDAFDYAGQSLAQEEMYKLTDTNGRLVVLRADNTTPVARVIATRLRSMKPPYKLFYNQNVYRINSDYSGRRSEIMQSGVEFAGIGGTKCDLMCITTAIKALRSLGIAFKLEIGHAGFCDALIEEMNLTEEQNEAVREYINAKNTLSLNFLKTDSDFSKIKQLPRLYGDSEVFERASKLAGENKRAQDSLENVREIYNALTDAGYGDDIMIDLGSAQSMEYYTGIVFKGYMEGIGEPVLSGGRYDNLIKSFDFDIPATGFAINVCLAADAMIKSGNAMVSESKAQKSCFIHFCKNKFKQAMELQEKMTADGTVAHMSYFDSLEESELYAKENEFDFIAVIDGDGTKITSLK